MMVSACYGEGWTLKGVELGGWLVAGCPGKISRSTRLRKWMSGNTDTVWKIAVECFPKTIDHLSAANTFLTSLILHYIAQRYGKRIFKDLVLRQLVQYLLQPVFDQPHSILRKLA